MGCSSSTSGPTPARATWAGEASAIVEVRTRSSAEKVAEVDGLERNHKCAAKKMKSASEAVSRRAACDGKPGRAFLGKSPAKPPCDLEDFHSGTCTPVLQQRHWSRGQALPPDMEMSEEYIWRLEKYLDDIEKRPQHFARKIESARISMQQKEHGHSERPMKMSL
mmetsp:Transcript_30952/g.70860  ORF Transcript_30952/g.70860 Transcript_30952/m.70860 type:complete len:165 (+) Transcript_30952:62-556(+)